MKTGVTFYFSSEQQVRTRAKLEPQQQRQAWERVIEIAQTKSDFWLFKWKLLIWRYKQQIAN